MSYTTFLILSFLIAAVAMFAGMLIGRQSLDDAPVDAEALRRLSEAKVAQKSVPIMMRNQAD